MANRAGQPNQAQLASMLAGATELKSRILFVLGILIVYRLGTHIPLPGIDAYALAQYQSQLQNGVLGMFNMFTGGAFARMSVFALNVMPYITASIIMQLMTTVSPKLAELKKEGETGRRKINQYTRYFTLILALVQGFGLAAGMEGATVQVANESMNVVANGGMMFRLQTALTLMTGTMFVMWLGEQINSRGIGNGISIIIFAGIVAELPRALFQTFELASAGSLSPLMVGGIFALVILVMGFVVFVETAMRKVPIQYPKRQMIGGMTGGTPEVSHMPMKLNTAGVIPAIFASSLLLLPMSIANFNPEAPWAQWVGVWFAPGKPLWTAFFVALIVFFCFFYTAIVFNPDDTADNLKKSGGFIPGIRPGKSTAVYLDFMMTRLTVIGAAYMSFVCVLPEIINSQLTVPFYLGGTSILIVVSVTIDLITRVQSHLIAQRYESLLKKSPLAGRKAKGTA